MIPLAHSPVLFATPYFKIQLVDDATGRGVPLVELRTVNQMRFVSDSAGLVAFNEPGLMGEREVFFHVTSPGYEVKPDAFGYRGVALRPKAGGQATIRLTRLNIAERLCRLTGQGIYRDSALLGERTPLKEPTLAAGVMGQDTAQAVVFRNRTLWFWGDTDRPGYPLGNFHTTGAVATLPKGGPDKGIDFRYFGDGKGFVKPMVDSKDHHPIWVSGLAVLGDELYAYYAQMESLGKQMSSGYLRWNDTQERFDIALTFDAKRDWRFIDGHTVQHDGWLLGNDPPNVRVRADAKSLFDASGYEAFTCLDSAGRISRKPDGKPDYRWQKTLPPITSKIEERLVKEGALKIEETHFLPLDEEGKPAVIVSGSVQWNAYRKRWIGIFGRLGGKDSLLGEIDYAEADAPTGPFRRAVKVCDHPKYTFYNPVHHAFLDRGSVIYFEGTYTAEFSGNEDKTPLYNYNQLLYRLDLSDRRLWSK